MTGPKIINHHIFSLFFDLLAAKRSTNVCISLNLWGVGDRVPSHDNLALMLPLSSDEIDLVVSSSNSNSSLGPDGFSVSFSEFLVISQIPHLFYHYRVF